MLSFFRYIGSALLERLAVLRSVFGLLALSLSTALFRFKKGRRATLTVFLKQVYFTGFEALPIISWIALILGLIIVTQSLNILPKLGGEGLVGEILVWIVIREAGPVLASVIVIARSGTAIASELGSMGISKEITALEVMGIDPMRYLIMPRVIGTAVSVFMLTFYFETVAILGGYLLAGLGKNIAFSAYAASVLESLGFLEVFVSLLKSALFGLIIGTVCSYHGLMVRKSITQIPQETTKAVIGSLRLVFVTDAVITVIFFT